MTIDLAPSQLPFPACSSQYPFFSHLLWSTLQALGLLFYLLWHYYIGNFFHMDNNGRNGSFVKRSNILPPYVLFFKFNPCNRWLHYRGFTLAPCDVSLAMLSLNHRIVRLMIDMLLHSYMHRWKNNLLRLRVRVQLVLGGLACINTIALQSVKDRLAAWKQEVVTNKRSESVHLT